MSKPLPCPFEAVEKDYSHQLNISRSDDSHKMPRVSCSCGCRGPVMGFDDESAIDGWNTRTPDRALQDAFEQVCAALEKSKIYSAHSFDCDYHNGGVCSCGSHKFYKDVDFLLSLAAPFRKTGV